MWFYVDNGVVYWFNYFVFVCVKFGIMLIYSWFYVLQGCGKIECFFWIVCL